MHAMVRSKCSARIGIPLRSHMAALPELTFDPPKTSDEGFGQWPLRRGVSAVLKRPEFVGGS